MNAVTGEQLRRRLDLRNFILGLFCALLLHLLIIAAALLIDWLLVQDIGDYSGPIMVKIGVPEAAESASPAPEKTPSEPSDNPQNPPQASSVPETVESGMAASQAQSPSETGQQELVQENPVNPLQSADSSKPNSVETSQKTAPVVENSQVRGSEKGNNYVMDFDASESEIGRAGAYEYIVSYMPLPEVLDAALVDGAQEYLSMSPDFIRGEIERYWEVFRGEYVKKPGAFIPFDERPYYWSLLENALGFNPENADWKMTNIRPVTIEFDVEPSDTVRGAALSNFRLVSRTNNPEVDDAIMHGISRWVYYNDTDRVIRGRITYDFRQ